MTECPLEGSIIPTDYMGRSICCITIAEPTKAGDSIILRVSPELTINKVLSVPATASR